MTKIEDKNVILTLIKYVFYMAFLISILMAFQLGQNEINSGSDYQNYINDWVSDSGSTVDMSHIEQYKYIKKVLPDMEDDTHLLINVKGINVRIYVDDLLNYETDTSYSSIEGKTPGSYYADVLLDSEDSGKEIRIEFNSPYHDDNGKINTMTMGEGNAAFVHTLKGKMPGFIICCICVFLGVVFMVFYVPLRMRGIIRKEMLYLGLFSVNAGVFMITDCGNLQLIFGHPALFHFIAETWMMLVVIPMFLYLDYNYQSIGKVHLRAISAIAVINYVVCMTLNVTGVADLHQTVNLTHIVYVLAIILMLRSVVISVLEKKEYVRWHLSGVVCVCVGVTMDIVALRLHLISESSMFTRLGILMFLALEAAQVIINLMSWYKNLSQDELVHQLAYKDGLTGLNNRTSYEEALDEFRDKNLLPVCVVFFDVNNLKYANDTFGHAAGDDLLSTVAKTIEDVYGEYGKCYRIGGDEFVFIATKLSEHTVDELEKMLADELKGKRISASSDFDITVAVGAAVLDGTTYRIIDDMVNRADSLMYENKKKMKAGIGMLR